MMRLPYLVLCTLLLASMAFAEASRHACSAVNLWDNATIDWELVMDLDSAQVVELGDPGEKQTDSLKHLLLTYIQDGSTWNYQYYSSMDSTAIVAIFAHMDYINTDLADDCSSKPFIDCIEFSQSPTNSIAIIRSRPIDSSSVSTDTASLGQVMEFELYRLQSEGILKADSAWIGQALNALRATAGGDDLNSVVYAYLADTNVATNLQMIPSGGYGLCTGALLYLGYPDIITPVLEETMSRALRLEALPDGSYALPVALREGSFTLRNAQGRSILYSQPSPWRIKPFTHPAYLESREHAQSWVLP